jgi:hypothetical protein
MNYNKLNFNLFVENSLASYRILQNEIPGEKSLPILQVISRTKNDIHREREGILKFLLSSNHIKKGITHSAWETQTYEYLIQNFYPLAQGLPVGFGKRFLQSMRNLPKDSPSETLGHVYTAFKDTAKISFHDKFTAKLKKTNKEAIEEELKNWLIRLNNQDFHGGKSPDKCDFFMYSCLEANWLFTRELVFKSPELSSWKSKIDKFSDQEHKRA